jgi:voltage-gated potassium channel
VNAKSKNRDDEVTPFQICLLVLSLVAVLALVIDAVAPLPREVSRTMQIGDSVVCLLLFVDVVNRFRKAPSKREFMRLGWIDFIACVPNVDFLRAGRLMRVLRIVRLLRGIRAGQRMLDLFRESRPRSALASALTIMILLVAFSSAGILIAEDGPEANIKTAEDAIWWSVTTITTVGYGDRFPTTTEGRAIAMVLMLCGVGLFGVLSGFVASLLLGKKAEEENSNLREIVQRLEKMEAKLNGGLDNAVIPRVIPRPPQDDAAGGRTGL